MAAEISEITDEITDRNQPDVAGQLEHILTDLHDAVRMLHAQGRLLAKHDALLEEFRPLLERFRSPLASRLPGRRPHG